MGQDSRSLGRRIRDARERKRWTQGQLASALGVDKKSVGNWERDKTLPRNSLAAIEAVLDVDLGEEAAAMPKLVADNYGDEVVRVIWQQDAIPASARVGMVTYWLEKRREIGGAA